MNQWFRPLTGLLRRWFRPPDFPGDEDKTRVARLLHVILPATAGTFLTGLLLIILIDEAPGPTVSVAVGILVVVFIGLWRLVFRGYVRAVSIIAPLIVLSVLSFVIYWFGGLSTSVTSSFVIVVILAALLLGRNGAWVFTLLTSLALFLLFLGEQSGMTASIRTTWSDLISYILVLMIVTLLVNASVQNLESALKNKRMQELALERSNDTLQDVLAGLEQKVEDRTHAIEDARRTLERQAWQAAGLARLAQVISGDQYLSVLSSNVTRELCEYLGVPVGALFLMENDLLRMSGSYAFETRKSASPVFRLGEGLVGQAALENKPIVLTRLAADYMFVKSSLVQIAPVQVMAVPFSYQGKVLGVLELALLAELNDFQREFVTKALENVALAFHTARTRRQVDILLAQTQEQTQALRDREEMLKSINEQLQAQTESLRNSQDKLRQQQVDLETANAELEERTAVLQQQRAVLDEQNQELTSAKSELQKRAEELTTANKYKSEFLANMSHELRTPLNSLLILARMLSNNDHGNLTPDQVESARIIHNSGSDLLALINEILDLSKVEAGRMTFHFVPMVVQNLVLSLRTQFDHMAREKGLQFEISLAEDLPITVETDQQRLEQIIRNLISNALKFTEQGAVTLRIETAGEMLAFRVSDTGIGMTPEQQQRVFEAFQQADGSTSRKYGGTGLGLTIAREMSYRLGGRIELESEPGKGSTFSLFIPLVHTPIVEPSADPATAVAPSSSTDSAASTPAHSVITPSATVAANDDRNSVKKGDRVLLIVEDDQKFAQILFDYAHKKEFKGLVAYDGETGLALARQYPVDAVLLDLNLPGISGWDVLDAFKQDADLRHIPVHILSSAEATLDAFKRGALGFLNKPASPEGLELVFQTIGDFVSRNIRNLLVVEDDSDLRLSVRQLLGGNDIKITEAASGQAALDALSKNRYDCMILDLTLSDMTGFELLGKINDDEKISRCPVIVYTGKELTEQENAQLLKYADSVIIKGVKSPERLLDETALFLHRVVADMPEEKRRTIMRLHDRDAVFTGKTILVVDDDMRNAFALSRVLNDKGVHTTIARSGLKALELLGTPNDETDLVLMDIMMPEMDGYETIRRIRAQERFASLPILALTAKAMKGDLDKCIEAGANDYLSKPLDTERLFSLLRVWLSR